jgi:hypothetical protein
VKISATKLNKYLFRSLIALCVIGVIVSFVYINAESQEPKAEYFTYQHSEAEARADGTFISLVNVTPSEFLIMGKSRHFKAAWIESGKLMRKPTLFSSRWFHSLWQESRSVMLCLKLDNDDWVDLPEMTIVGTKTTQWYFDRWTTEDEPSAIFYTTYIYDADWHTGDVKIDFIQSISKKASIAEATLTW